MKPVTAKHLKRLEGATWFANVGKPLKDHVLLATWDQAIEHADGDHWMEEIHGMANHFGAIIDREHYDRRRDFWNLLIGEMSIASKPLIEAKLAEYQRYFKNKENAEHSLLNIVRLSCMECEYSDVVPLGYFYMLAELVIAGRFPCGYNGEYPHGQLFVY